MTSASVRRVLRHLPVVLGGRPLHGAERFRPFFIVGSGHCGSTLLRAILEAHPAIHIPPENALRHVIRDYRRYSRLPWNAVLRIVLGNFELRPRWELFELALPVLFRDLDAVPARARNLATVLDAFYRAHARRHKPSADRWGDKTPDNAYALTLLRTVFPDLKVIHVVRDGRDVVRSFMVAAREDLPLAAERWLRAVRVVRAFGARYPGSYREVRYEDLVRQTRPIVEGVAAFLDVGFDERLLRHDEMDLPLGSFGRLPARESVRGPIHQESIGRWRTAFNSAQIAELDRLLGPTMAELGYSAELPGMVSGATPKGHDR